jgi:hypothetical protein
MFCFALFAVSHKAKVKPFNSIGMDVLKLEKHKLQFVAKCHGQHQLTANILDSRAKTIQ